MAESLPNENTNIEPNTNSVSDLLNIECAVCLQTCVHPAELPCGHIFCFLCIKGIANQGRRCAMCRQTIPVTYLDQPHLLKPCDGNMEAPGFEDGHQWFYEGQNGWWQYDERTSLELETAYQKGERVCELLVAGYLYVMNFDSMIQVRRHEPGRRRRIKRDLCSIPKKGIAGIKVDSNAGLPDKSSTQQPIRSPFVNPFAAPFGPRTEDADAERVVPRRSHRSRRSEPTLNNSEESDTSTDLNSVIDQTLDWTIQQIESLQLDISNQSEALTEDISRYERLQTALEHSRPRHRHNSLSTANERRLNRSLENELDLSERLNFGRSHRRNRSEENVSTNNENVLRIVESSDVLSNYRNRLLLRSMSSTEFPDSFIVLNNRLRISESERRTEERMNRSRRNLPRSLSLRNRLTSPLTLDGGNKSNSIGGDDSYPPE